MLENLVKDLDRVANPAKAKILARFFKTGPGEYGEGDIFLGITVPVQREIAKKYLDLDFSDLQKLLNNQYHEYRLVALLILVEKYKKGTEKEKKEIFNLYLKNAKAKRINNWDLVDLSAPTIVGDYLFARDKRILYTLAKSRKLWERRIAILATYSFIKQKKYSDILKLSKILISDSEDLIHKATGWMLREMGKKDKKVLENFLHQFADRMPRTMLRYAIEKFNPIERQKYLNWKKK
ncbi:MAG: DNA alkylation repair protein [Candidatus Paceibacterota bacterium]